MLICRFTEYWSGVDSNLCEYRRGPRKSAMPFNPRDKNSYIHSDLAHPSFHNCFRDYLHSLVIQRVRLKYVNAVLFHLKC